MERHKDRRHKSPDRNAPLFQLAFLGLMASLVLSTACAGTGNGSVQGQAGIQPTSKSVSMPTLSAQSTRSPVFPKREPAVITMFTTQEPQSHPIAGTRLGRIMLDRLQVTLEIEYLVGDQDTREGVLIASGVLPDLIGTRSVGKWVDAGLVMPLDELLETYGGNIRKGYGPDLDWLRQAKDGKIYSLTSTRSNPPGYRKPLKAMYLQQAVLREFGYPRIKTIDEYFDILRKYADRHPMINGKKTIAFAMLADDWRFGIGVMGPVKFLNGYPDDGEVFVDKTESVYRTRLHYASPESKAYFRKVNALYLGGFLDESVFTNTYEQYKDKISEGRVLGFHDQVWEFIEAESVMLQRNENADRIYVGLPIVADHGVSEKYMQRDPMDINTGILIASTCRQPERVMMFLDDIMSDEIQILNNWGEPGIDFLVDDKGKYVWNEEQRKNNTDQAYRKKNGFDALIYPFPRLANDQKLADGNDATPYGDASRFPDQYTKAELDFCAAYGIINLHDLFSLAPISPYGLGWSMVPLEGSDDAAANAMISAFELMRNHIPKTVLAPEGAFDTVWKEFEEKLSKIDVKAYTDFMDAKIQERLRTNNPVLP